jgi:ribokinase
MVELATSGWLTTDDIVLQDGTAYMGIPGGGALYSAVGARVWSASVGIHAAAGRAHLATTRRVLAQHGIDDAGLVPARGDGIAFWLLHESDTHKQQVAKRRSQPPPELDEDRGPLPDAYASARGVHIAPQGPASGIAAARGLASRKAVVTMDVLSDAIIDIAPYRDLAWTQHIDAFLPSEAEIADIWAPPSIPGWLTDTARSGRCHMVGKLGRHGALVAEAGTGRLIEVPALTVDVVDTTGAGDAFCGGFLAGLAAGRDLAVCAAMGTVSASYAIAAQGVPQPGQVVPDDRDARLNRVLAGIVEEQRACG